MKAARWIIPILFVLLGLYAVGCGGDDNKNPVNPGGGTPDVTIQIVGNLGANSYSPDTATVTVGQTVAWHNADGAAHTATADNGVTFGTGTISPGATSATTAMNSQGTFPYHCTIHGVTMAGTLVVVP